MIPLRDNVPRVNTPVAVIAVIALNALVFLLSQSLPPQEQFTFFHLFGLVPDRFLDPQWSLASNHPGGTLYPFVSYMFVHSGWLHIIANMWMLWIFGDNIEDVTGPWGFALFYLLCGLVAAGTQMLAGGSSAMPVVGASGAIAGVMGAYLILYLRGTVLTLVPIFIFPLFLRIPAPVFLGIWFVAQVVSGLITTAHGAPLNVAWWAHIGGFLAGLALIHLFKRKGHCKYCYNNNTRDYE